MSIFRISVEKIQVSLKSEKNNRYFTRRPMYIYDNVALNCSYNGKCSRQSCRENQNKHFVLKILFRRSHRFMG